MVERSNLGPSFKYHSKVLISAYEDEQTAYIKWLCTLQQCFIEIGNSIEKTGSSGRSI